MATTFVGAAIGYGCVLAVAIVVPGDLSPARLALAGILQNLWRPILIGRVANVADEATLATVFIVESLAESLGAAMTAPLIGMAMTFAPETYRFVPIGVFGILIGIVVLISSRRF